jgi:hypothetical protein
MISRVEKLSSLKVVITNFMSKSPFYETNFMDWLTQQKLADLAGQVQIFGSIFESVPERMFEKCYSVIFITLLPPLVPPCKGGKQ